jgi:hypothetical protein
MEHMVTCEVSFIQLVNPMGLIVSYLLLHLILLVMKCDHAEIRPRQGEGTMSRGKNASRSEYILHVS